MEGTVKKREWVKNALIIFLAIMLVLTFFSNTIMNRSLPEVATECVVNGEIVNKVRGNGTVTANESYEVSLSMAREVESVKIHEGDEVKEGDLLFVLSAAKSSDYQSAVDNLRQLNLAYNKALIQATEYDYAKDDLAIQRAKEDLQVAQAKQTKVGNVTDAQLANAQAAYDKAEENYNKAKKVADSYGTGSESSSGTYAEYAADAKSQLSSDILTYGSELKDLVKIVVKDRLANANKELDSADKFASDSGYTSLIDAYTDYEYNLLIGQSVNKNAIKASTAGNTQLEKLREKFETLNVKTGSDDNELSSRVKQAATTGYTSNVTGSDVTISATYNQAKAYNTITSDVSNWKYYESLAASETNNANSANQASSVAQQNLRTAEANLNAAEADLKSLQAKRDEYDSASESVRQAQRNLEDLVLNLNIQKKSDSIDKQIRDLDLLEMKAQIASAAQALNDLNGEAAETEIRSKVNGVVKSVTAVAGKTCEGTIAEITLPDQGYFVSINVTTEQAKKVRVGDVGDIANYYYGDTQAIVESIKADPKNPQTNKIINFELTGDDIAEGSSITISVGQRSAEYDTIVPNSAVRSDSNGDFVLVVNAKSSPLSTRYTAVRVPIEKLASDDQNTAITGAVSANDYVITTSSKPLNNKDQVKLADA